MKDKPANVTRMRLSKLSEQKLQERSAVLYTRELERWNRKPPLRSE
ncbi:MAG TPA: hypothetical protein VFH72_08510 [Candidatus Baltobacteraceae bacterium]|jgi:hypothetical protein|nr:hypothetical protein [Candidatus Baltobacteraceae bacterium]